MSAQDLSQFSKAVTSTASALLSQDLILSYSSPYKKLLHQSISQAPASALVRKGGSFHHSKEYFKRTNSDAKTSYKVLSYISDELLADAPASVSKALVKKKQKASEPSLFQGFEASLPAINETVDMQKRISDGHESAEKVLGAHADDEFSLPVSYDTAVSPEELSANAKEMENSLDMLEIQKNIAASEIREIDAKIKKLNMMRELVFKRVAKLEQNEIFLEKHMALLQERLDSVRENADTPIGLASKTGGDVSGAGFASVGAPRETEMDTAAKSVYHKIKRTPHKRRTQPTLQQYYEPGTRISQFQAASDTVTCLDFDVPFGYMASTATLDTAIKIWDLNKQQHVSTLDGHLASVHCLQMGTGTNGSSDIVISGGADALIKVWGIDAQECYMTLESHVDSISAISCHEHTLVSGSQDRTIRQWDLNRGKCLQTIDLWTVTSSHTPTSVNALQCFDAALATGTSDGLVRLWDLRSGQVVRTLEGHTAAVTCLQFDAHSLVTGSMDRSIRQWDLRTGKLADAFAYESPVSSLQFDRGKIVCSNGETTVKVYDRETEQHMSCEMESIVSCVKYKEGYIVGGDINGGVATWAI